MNKKSLLALLRFSLGFSFLLSSVGFCAGAHHDFQAGKLLDISSDEQVKKGTSHQFAIYQVQVGDIVYFGRGEKQVKHPGDTGRGLIVGDPVQAVIEKDDLIIQRPDGKEIKTKIIKRQRAEAK